MAHHGSNQYRRGHIRYDGPALKTINAVWGEVFEENFKPEPKENLGDMIIERIGTDRYHDASGALAKAGNLKFMQVYFDPPSGSRQPIEIPRKLRPLAVLAMDMTDSHYSAEDGVIHIRQAL